MSITRTKRKLVLIGEFKGLDSRRMLRKAIALAKERWGYKRVV